MTLAIVHFYHLHHGISAGQSIWSGKILLVLCSYRQFFCIKPIYYHWFLFILDAQLHLTKLEASGLAIPLTGGGGHGPFLFETTPLHITINTGVAFGSLTQLYWNSIGSVGRNYYLSWWHEEQKHEAVMSGGLSLVSSIICMLLMCRKWRVISQRRRRYLMYFLIISHVWSRTRCCLLQCWWFCTSFALHYTVKPQQQAALCYLLSSSWSCQSSVGGFWLS